ncbi:hypothetical protein GBAR_LOCUS6308 [Geodia barretti]|nr:hypothetical protein GBAR_LOCUS6308 [Geodia barretti]
MHRSISNDDVVEYPANIPAGDVELVEEEDIEYKDGRLVKSNGTMHLLVERVMSTQQDDGTPTEDHEDEFSNIFNVRGNFSMELRVCRLVPRTARRRRGAVRENIDSDSSSEETLMASFDQKKSDLETLEKLRENLQTSDQMIAAIRNANNTKFYKVLEVVMVLESKYGAKGTPMIEHVLDYLNEVIDEKSETYEIQRLNIYSLLGTEGSLQAQNVLMERLRSPDLSDMERNSLILAVASLPDPSSGLIQTLEHMIAQNEETTTLLLAYGALVANVAPDREREMVKFITDRLPRDPTDIEVLIHVLHALGNTQSMLAVEHIIHYSQHEDEAVGLAAVTALRLFTSEPSVQQQFIYTLGNYTHSVALVSAIIDALRDGFEQNRQMTFNEDLIHLLTNITLDLGNSALENELVDFLKLVGTRETLALADMINTSSGLSRQKRLSSTDWSSTDSNFNAVCPLSERVQDESDFPNHRAYLWWKRIGRTSSSYPFYVQATAGAFAGYSSNCDFKVKAKALIRGCVLSREGEIVNILGSYVSLNGQMNGKLYVKFGSNVVLDINQNVVTSFTRTYNLPTYRRTLFTFSYTFTVWIIPLTLSVDVQIGLRGTMQVSGNLNAALQARAEIAPTAYASVTASVSVSLLIGRAGLSLTGSTEYSIGVEASVNTCWVNPSVAVTVYDEWPGGQITFSAFYQWRSYSWWSGVRFVPNS